MAEAGQACSQDGWEAGPAMFLNGLRRTPVQAVPGRSGLLRRYNSWFRPGNVFERPCNRLFGLHENRRELGGTV